MSLLHRLSLAQKFLMLGLIALLMVIVPSTLYFQDSLSAVAVAKTEARSGGSVMAPS